MTILLCDILLAIQKHLDVLSGKFYAQRVPLVARNGRINVVDGISTSALGVIERNVVFQRVGSRHVVVVAVLPPPYQPAGLILTPFKRLELDLCKAVGDRG